MNEELENAIHECEKILSKTLGYDVLLVEPPQFNVAQRNNKLTNGELHLSQFYEDVTISLTFNGKNVIGVGWTYH